MGPCTSLSHMVCGCGHKAGGGVHRICPWYVTRASCTHYPIVALGLVLSKRW